MKTTFETIIGVVIGIVCAYILYAQIVLTLRHAYAQYKLHGFKMNNWDFDSFWDKFQY